MDKKYYMRYSGSPVALVSPKIFSGSSPRLNPLSFVFCKRSSGITIVVQLLHTFNCVPLLARFSLNSFIQLVTDFLGY
jgi:hypothetical protein